MSHDCRSAFPGGEEITYWENGCTVSLAEGISEHDFQRLCSLIKEHSGIQIAMGKKILLEGRIGRRMHQLGLCGFHEYCEYLFSTQGMSEELSLMIDSVTTNKTDFFREPWHFDFLQKTALPVLQKLYGAGISRKLYVWCAACSTGEEPFTIAMTLADIAESTPRFQYEILATDLSTAALEKALSGIYSHDRIDQVPMSMRKKYLLKSRDQQKALVKIDPELQKKVIFRKLNLINESYNIPFPMDVIFCRNVIIYFDRQTQERTINRICRHLVPGGYLFMGHAETLTNMRIEVKFVATSTYQKSLRGIA
jgi:chemotaxis protein methyltransferase CheR